MSIKKLSQNIRSIKRRNNMEKKHRVFDPESGKVFEIVREDDGRITKMVEAEDKDDKE